MAQSGYKANRKRDKGSTPLNTINKDKLPKKKINNKSNTPVSSPEKGLRTPPSLHRVASATEDEESRAKLRATEPGSDGVKSRSKMNDVSASAKLGDLSDLEESQNKQKRAENTNFEDSDTETLIL